MYYIVSSQHFMGIVKGAALNLRLLRPPTALANDSPSPLLTSAEYAHCAVQLLPCAEKGRRPCVGAPFDTSIQRCSVELEANKEETRLLH
jgi:hypothetical protein